MNTATAPVRDARPPLALVRAMNPTLRLLLRTPLGRLVRPFGLLEFHGRTSGRHYRMPVGVHHIDDELTVFSPAAWRQNFAGGHSATLRFRGRTSAVTGVLVAEPNAVAALLRSLEAGGTPLTRVGLRVEPGHELAANDVLAVDRAAIHLHPRATPRRAEPNGGRARSTVYGRTRTGVHEKVTALVRQVKRKHGMFGGRVVADRVVPEVTPHRTR